MYPSNSIFQLWAVSTAGTSTQTVNGKLLTFQFSYFQSTPTFQVSCDGQRIFQYNSVTPGLTPLIPIFRNCETLQTHLDSAGSVDFYYSYATTTPVYNFSITNSVSQATNTVPQYTQGDFFTQFLLIIIICMAAFGGMYRGIFGERVTPNYK